MAFDLHPYRTVAKSAKPAGDGARSEELTTYAILIVIGAIPVSVPLRTGGNFGVEPTIGIILIVLGLLGILVTVVRRGSAT